MLLVAETGSDYRTTRERATEGGQKVDREMMIEGGSDRSMLIRWGPEQCHGSKC